MSSNGRERIRNWRDHKGYKFGERAYGNFENGIFIVHHDGQHRNEFSIVCCKHEEALCKAYEEETCPIRVDHQNE